MSGQQRRGLLPQLSGSLGRSGSSSAAAAASGSLDPALRAALARRASSGVSGSFAAQAAVLRSGQPEATLAMFRRLNAEQEASQAATRGGKPAHHGSAPPEPRMAGLPAPGSDSAWHTEAEAEELGSPGSQASTAQVHSWAEAQGGSKLPEGRPAGASSPGGVGGQSAFAPAAAREFSGLTDNSRVASPLPRSPCPARQWLQDTGSQLRAELLRQLPSALAGPHPALSAGSTRSDAAESAFYSAAGGGAGTAVSGLDTPRSAVSWASALALPQTESELAQLDLEDVRQLAAEAEALQQRATLALRLARLRMGRPGNGQGSSDEGRGAGGGGGGSASGAEHGLEGGASAAGADTEAPQQQQQQKQQQQQQQQQQSPGSPYEGLELVQHGQEPGREQQGPRLGPADVQAEGWEPEDLGQPQWPQQPPLEEQELEQEWDIAAEGAMGPPATAAGIGDVAGCGGMHAAGSPTAGTSGSAKEATSGALPASALPEPVHVVLQLVVLAAAVLEAALLWGASLGERASGGVLQVPRALVRAPPAVLRGGVMVAAVLLELLACLAHVLCGQPPA